MKRNIQAFTLQGIHCKGYAKEPEGLFELGALVENPEQYDGQTITFGGLIENKTDRMTRRNEVMSILRIEDYSGVANVVAFPKVFSQSQQFLAGRYDC